MKTLLYATSTVCLILSVAIAAKGRATQLVLPDNATTALQQTGVLPVRVQAQNSGMAPALALATVGLGLAAAGAVDWRSLQLQQQPAQTRSLNDELAELLERAERGALFSADMEQALRQRFGNEWRTRLGLPIELEDLTVELPSDLQPIGSGTSEKKEEPKPAPEPKPVEPKALDHSRDPRYAGLFQLLDAPCIRIFGPQGSGKSSKLAWFGLEQAKRGDRVMVINPLAKAGDFKGLKVYGKGLSYRDAEEGLREFVLEAKRRLKDRGTIEDYDPLVDEAHWTLLCDEMSDWGEWVSSEVMQELVGVQQQFLRQANMSVRQVSHGDTNAMNGGEALRGRKEAMNRQFYKIETSAMHDPTVPGRLRCSGRALLHVPDRPKPIQIEIPVWIQAPKNHDYRPFLKNEKVVQLKA